MIIENGNVVWAKMRGYPTWPSVICKETSTGLYKKGKGSSTKFHVRFLGGDWAPSWILKTKIEKFRKQDTEEHRGKRYRVCPKWEILHLKAMQAGLRILANTKPKKTSRKTFTGAKNKTKKTGDTNASPMCVQAEREDAQGSNELKKTAIAARKHLRLNKSILGNPMKSAGSKKDGQSLVRSSLALRKLTDFVVETGFKRNVNGLVKTKARSEHGIGGFKRNVNGLVKTKARSQHGIGGFKRNVNGLVKTKARSQHGIGENMYDLIKKRNKPNDGIGTIIGSISKTKKIPVIGDHEREQNEIPIRSLFSSESNNDFGNLNNVSDIGSLVDLSKVSHNVFSVPETDDSLNQVDNDDIVDSIAAKDAVSNETRNVSGNEAIANFEDSKENIEEIPRRELVISAVNVSITRTLTKRINDNMIIQRIQEAHYPNLRVIL